jgi:hypothetical protein
LSRRCVVHRVTGVTGMTCMWGLIGIRVDHLRRNVLLRHPDGRLDSHRIAEPTAQRQQQDGEGQDQDAHGNDFMTARSAGAWAGGEHAHWPPRHGCTAERVSRSY